MISALRILVFSAALGAAQLEVQAFSERFWAPRAELWLELDGKERLDLSAPTANTPLLAGAASDYWSGRIAIRQAIRAWLERGESPR